LFYGSVGTGPFKLSKIQATSENFELFPYKRSQEEILYELGKPVCPDALGKRASCMGFFGTFVRSYVFLLSV